MHRSNTDGEGAGTDANQASALPRSAACGPTEFHPRRTDPPLLSGSTAGDLTSGSPAPFVELGSAVQAVVLRLANSRIRLRVLSPDRWEEGDDREER